MKSEGDILNSEEFFQLIVKGEEEVWFCCGKSRMRLKIISFSTDHIDCIVLHDHKTWRFTGFYGSSIPASRHISWKLLKRLYDLHEFQKLPWLVGGDFNEILFESEKSGGSLRSLAQMSDFNEVINACGLNDLNFKGNQVTWCNRRFNAEIIFERVDRFFCNLEWHNLFPMAEVHHLDFFRSDHRLISISMKSGCETIFKKGPKRFMFEHKWMLDGDFKEIMQQCLPSNNQVDLPKKLTMFSELHQKWAGSRFSHLPRQIESLRKELASLLTPDNVVDKAGRIAELEGNIEKLTCQEEMHWKQRARTNWFAQGDGNTKFFHFYASERKRINHINKIFDECGNWCSKNEDITEIFLKYYANIFTSSNPTNHDIEEAIISIGPIVDDNMNSTLCAPYTSMEVKKALFDTHPSKAPGNDGFTVFFFQKNWDIVGDEVTEAILNILNENGDLSSWNSTVIVLIHP